MLVINQLPIYKPTICIVRDKSDKSIVFKSRTSPANIYMQAIFQKEEIKIYKKFSIVLILLFYILTYSNLHQPSVEFLSCNQFDKAARGPLKLPKLKTKSKHMQL